MLTEPNNVCIKTSYDLKYIYIFKDPPCKPFTYNSEFRPRK